MDSDCILKNHAVKLIVEQWTTSFSLVLEKRAPLHNRCVSENFCPWVTNDFKVMCTTRVTEGMSNLLIYTINRLGLGHYTLFSCVFSSVLLSGMLTKLCSLPQYLLT